MRFARAGLAGVVVLLVVVGCGPRPAPGPQPPPLNVYVAINQAFHPYGGDALVNKALRVSKCESGWVVTAGAGRYYQGLFQLGDHIVAINNYGGDRLNAWQNAQAARDLWLTRGRSWSAWPVCGRR